MSIFRRALSLESAGDIQMAFHALTKALRAKHPSAKLVAGFSSKDISTIKSNIPTVPSSIIDLYKCGLIGCAIYKGYNMLESASQMTGEYSTMCELAGEGDSEAKPVPGIKKHWYYGKWIPFTWDGSGNSLCVDLDPDHGGVKGQIIEVVHDDPVRKIIAPDMVSFLELCIEEANK